LPGVYCTVELKIPRKSPALIVPASAIIFYQDGKQVAVVENGSAHLHKITITTDYRTEVQVSEGVKRSSCNRRSTSPSARRLWCKWRSPIGYAAPLSWSRSAMSKLKIAEELFKGRPFERGSSSCGCVGIIDTSWVCETWWR
jgi:hypothetical protein